MKSLVKITGVLLLCVNVSCRKNQLEEISAKDNNETIVAQQTQAVCMQINTVGLFLPL